MDNIGIGFDFDDSGLEGLDKVDDKLTSIDKKLSEISKVSAKAFNDVEKSVSDTNKELDKNVKSTAKAEKEYKKLSDTNKKTSKSYLDIIKNQKVFGISINDGQTKLTAYQAKFKESLSTITSFGKANKETGAAVAGSAKSLGAGRKAVLLFANGFKILRTAIIATGIGAIVVALGSLLAFLTRTQEGVNFLNRATAVLGAAFDVLVDRAAALGKAIFEAFKDPEKAIGDLWEAIKQNFVNRFLAIPDLFKSTAGLIATSFKFLAQQAKLAFADVPLLGNGIDKEQVKKNLKELTKLSREQLADIGTATIQVTTGFDEADQQKSKDLFKDITKEIINEASATDKLELARQKLEKSEIRQITRSAKLRAEIKEQNKIAEDTSKSTEERIEAATKAYEASNTLLKEELSILNAKAGILAKQQALGNSTIEDERELATARAAAFNKEREVLELQTTLQNKINILKDEEKRKLEEIQQAYIDVRDSIIEKAEANNLEALNGEQRIEAERKIALAEIEQLEEVARKRAEEAGKTFDLESEFADLRRLANQKADQEITDFRAEELKKRIAKENEAFDAQSKVIEQQKAVALAEVDLLEKSTSKILSLEEFKEQKRLEIQKKAAEEQLKVISQRFGEDSPEAKLLEAQITNLEKSLESVGESSNIFVNLFKKFGINEEAQGILKEQLSGVFSTISEGILANTEAQIDQQSRIIESLDQRIDDTESALERELDLKKNGFSNDSDLLKQTLTEQQEERDKATRKRLELEKEAARERLVLESLQQASSLATAAAQVFAAEANKGLLGVAFAIGAIATIFTQFKKFKANAAQQIPSFFKGTKDTGDGSGQQRVNDGKNGFVSILHPRERVLERSINSQLDGVENPTILKAYKFYKKYKDSLTDISQAGRLGGRVMDIEERRGFIKAHQSNENKETMKEAYESAAMKSVKYLAEENRKISRFGRQKTLLSDGRILEETYNEKGDLIRSAIRQITNE